MTAKRRPAVLERALRRPAGTESAYERTREKEQNP